MDSQGGRLGEIIEHGEPVSQQVAGSKGKINNKPEECQVCKKRFKSARGVKIHQGKSGCKVALRENRIRKSKPEVGEIQESNHRDFTCINDPERAASTSSTKDLNTYRERIAKDWKPEITLSQDISLKLKQLRKDSEILIICDETETSIQNSIIQAEGVAQLEDRMREEQRIASEQSILVIDSKREREIRESILIPEEEDTTASDSEEDCTSTETSVRRNETSTTWDKDVQEVTKGIRDVDINNADVPDMKRVIEILDSDEEVKGRGEIERI